MQFTLPTILAVAFPLLANAHLHITSMQGAYFTSQNLDPIDRSGSNFPCTAENFDRKNGEGPTLIPGMGSNIQLIGTAVHGGGSCQISITYDSPPNKNSDWRVIKSFEGGCPIKHDGNLPPAWGDYKLPPLEYTVPQGLPTGAATIAWTWVNSTGNREFYMRCQAVKIGGNGTNKQAFDQLPPMFVANVPTQNQCTTYGAEGKSIIFPNPGSVKVGNGDVPPNGNDCYTAAQRSRGRK